VDALARPINLKNHSIDVIKRAFPHIPHSDIVRDTHKGTVCLFEPPKTSVELVNQPEPITHVIFPKYIPEVPLAFSELPKDQLFFDLIENSFNYNVLGIAGFNCITDLLPNVDAFNFNYSDNKAAIVAFEELSNVR
jgi:hypothetical protein